MKKLPPCAQDENNQSEYWAARFGEQRKPIIEQRRLRRKLLRHQLKSACPICKQRYRK